MITRQIRKLIGLVKKVETDFAVFENINGILKETRHQFAGYSIYDLEGRLVEEVSPYRLMMYDAYKDIYFYDENGELAYREEYDENNLLIGKSVFEKSVYGNLKENNYYFDDTKNLKLGSHLVYEGDNNDQDADIASNSSIIEVAHYDKDEKINPQHFHKYDSSERIKIETTHNESGRIDQIYAFNDKGEFSHKMTRVYDLNGNNIEHFCYDSDGTLYLKDEYVYKFDLVGNWIEQVDHHWVIGWGEFNLTPLSITRRKIEYFDKN
jgi:site-specific DNA-cytosine methylase